MQTIFLTENHEQQLQDDRVTRASQKQRSAKSGAKRKFRQRAPSEARSEQMKLFELAPKQSTPMTLEQALKQNVFSDFWEYQTLLTQSRDTQGRSVVLEVQGNHCPDNPHASNLHETERPLSN